jgi:hypothetical protein
MSPFYFVTWLAFGQPMSPPGIAALDTREACWTYLEAAQYGWGQYINRNPGISGRRMDAYIPYIKQRLNDQVLIANPKTGRFLFFGSCVAGAQVNPEWLKIRLP